MGIASRKSSRVSKGDKAGSFDSPRKSGDRSTGGRLGVSMERMRRADWPRRILGVHKSGGHYWNVLPVVCARTAWPHF